MTDSNEIRKWTAQLKDNAGLIFQAASWILTLLSGFLLQPPVSRYQDLGSSLPRNYAQFIAAITVGLIFVATRQWNRRRDLKIWVGSAIVFLMLSAVTFFFYSFSIDDWTCKFEGQPIIIGEKYTELGVINKDRFGPDCMVLLRKVGGNAEILWEIDAIRWRRSILQVTYICSIPLFTICLICALQAMRCSTREDEEKKKRKYYAGAWRGENRGNKVELNLQVAENVVSGDLTIYRESIVAGSEPYIPDGPHTLVSSDFQDDFLRFFVLRKGNEIEYRMALTENINEASLDRIDDRAADISNRRAEHWHLSRGKGKEEKST